jgi:hypothetical protein
VRPKGRGAEGPRGREAEGPKGRKAEGPRGRKAEGPKGRGAEAGWSCLLEGKAGDKEGDRKPAIPVSGQQSMRFSADGKGGAVGYLEKNRSGRISHAARKSPGILPTTGTAYCCQEHRAAVMKDGVDAGRLA